MVPVAGAIVVAFLVKTFAPEAKGHGVPEVMDAVYYHEGKIRPVVAVVKSIASAISIGSGGSVGREGPIIQIGAAFGSSVGQVISMPTRQRAMLIAAGAGGGIAATFNTPIGGIVFAIELMMPVVSPMSLLCVALSCITATYVGRSFFGVLPSFNIPSLALVEGPGVPVSVLPWFVLFGLLLGLAAWAMTRGIYWFEDFFDSLPGNYYTRHMSGMLLVGLIVYGLMSYSTPLFGQPNHYYVQGVGYATIMDILRGDLTAVGFLLLLAVAKLLVTCLTLGSGASGGVFSPSMFIGAALGGCVGGALGQVFPGFAATPCSLRLRRHGGHGGGHHGGGRHRHHHGVRDDPRLHGHPSRHSHGDPRLRGAAVAVTADHLHPQAPASWPCGPPGTAGMDGGAAEHECHEHGFPARVGRAGKGRGRS